MDDFLKEKGKLQKTARVCAGMEVAMNQVVCVKEKEGLLGDGMDNGRILVNNGEVLVEEEKNNEESPMEDRNEDEDKVAKENYNDDRGKRLLCNQGFGVVEVILLIVIIVALIILFRDKIQEIFEKAMSALTQSTDSILNRVTPAP